MRAVATIALATLAGACTSNTTAESKPVASTIKVDTNMQFGAEFDEFTLTIQQKGFDAENLSYYSRNGVELPAFRHIVPGAEKRPYVTVWVEGFLGEESKVQSRKANFFIPEDYAVWLPGGSKASTSRQSLGLRPLAAGSPAEPTGGFQLDLLVDGLCSRQLFTEECPEGETCIGGVCRDSTIDLLTLPVFGQDGDTGSEPAECHDILKCFEDGLDLGSAGCQITSTAPAGMTNIAVALAADAGVGTCDTKRCLLPLDYGEPPHGWTRTSDADGGASPGLGGMIQIDPALCAAAANESIKHFLGFVASGACPTFQRNVTPCPVTPPGGPDGGPPGPDAGPDGSAALVVSAIEEAVDGTIHVRFSLALRPDDTSALTVLRDGAAITGTVSVAGQDLVFRPARPLALRTNYEVRVSAGVAAASGSTLSSAFTSTLTTRDGTWRAAEVVSPRAGTGARLAIGPSGEALVAFLVGRALQSARWSFTAPTWAPSGVPGGFVVDGSFLLGSDTTWGAMALAQDGASSSISSSRYSWKTGSWDEVWLIASTSGPTLFDVLVHEGQGWGFYATSSELRIGTHGGKPFFVPGDPAQISAASLCADASGGVTAVLGGSPSSSGTVISAQTVSSSGQLGQVQEVGRDDKLNLESLRAVGDGTGRIDAFWIQQVITPDRVAQVMTSRRDSGTWSPPRELSRATGTFLSQLRVVANPKVTVVTWLDHHVTRSDGGFGTPDIHVIAMTGAASGEDEIARSSPDTNTHPSIAVDPSGNASVVWWNTLAIGTSRLGKDGAWSRPAQIPGSDGANDQPDVAFDVDGRGWAVWTGTAGVQASRFE